MLSYNTQRQVFEYTDTVCEAYISEQLKHNSSWNETQLKVIVETLVNFLNTVFEVYQHYLGNVVELLKKLQSLNQQQADVDKKFIQEIIAIRYDATQPLPIKKIAYDITMPYQLCINHLVNLNLNRGLQKHFAYSQAQLDSLHQIIADLLLDAIDTLTHSALYQQAATQGTLYFNLEEWKNSLNGEESILSLKSDMGAAVPTSHAINLNY